MTRKIIDEIHDQLLEIDFKGTITLSGYGEPLLHKDISYVVKKLSNVSRVEIVTNGDALSSKILQELYISNVSKVLVSMYDGPDQVNKFKTMTKKANVPEDLVILRDRWYDQQNDFGVKLTNRAGTVKTGVQEKIGKYSTCFYPTYQFLIDWDGNVYLCPQDWQRRVSMGNIMQNKHISFRQDLLDKSHSDKRLEDWYISKGYKVVNKNPYTMTTEHTVEEYAEKMLKEGKWVEE